jgi:acylphosphatase
MGAAPLRLLIAGRVQGVGFRAFVAREARALGLAGFVRNLADGRVEVVAAGAAAAVAALRDACGRGPAGARVDRIEEPPAARQALPAPFEVRGDA